MTTRAPRRVVELSEREASMALSNEHWYDSLDESRASELVVATWGNYDRCGPWLPDEVAACIQVRPARRRRRK